MLSYTKGISLEKAVYISPLVTGRRRQIELDHNPVSGSVSLTHTKCIMIALLTGAEN